MASTEQNGWITTVLGYRFGAEGAPVDTGRLRAAADRWTAAVELVDGQIAVLAQSLRDVEDEELNEIGEFGLNALTGNFKVRLQAALFGALAGNPADTAKLRGQAENLRKQVESDDRIEACDENPFGVPVTIRSTLVPVLADIVAASQ